MATKVEVAIQSMAFKGYGITRVDGKVLFIPYSVTGDKIQAEIIEEKKDYSIGRLIKIIEPSPWRVNPPCPYFGVCGGCQWQHIGYSFHGELKSEILREILKRVGRMEKIPFATVSPSREPYGYRARVQLKVKGKAIGYYQERSQQVVDIDHCPISHPLINLMIPILREERSFFSRMDGVEINVSPEEGKGILILYLLPSLSFDRGMDDFLRTLLQNFQTLKGIVVVGKSGPNVIGDPSLNFSLAFLCGGEERILRLRASPGSFFQVNPGQNRSLVETVLDLSATKKDEKVLDLYAGIGNLTLPLATVAKEVTGVEENGVAVEDARVNAERNGIRQCHFIPGRVEEVLKNWRRPRPDLIVLDPPRAGCKGMIDRIVVLRPRRMVYIACDPATFSRDLHLFSERRYDLQRLALIDMFPQSYHMEVVGLLTQSQVKI